MNVCLLVCTCAVCRKFCRGQKTDGIRSPRAGVINCPVWVLKIKSGSFIRAVRTLFLALYVYVSVCWGGGILILWGFHNAYYVFQSFSPPTPLRSSSQIFFNVPFVTSLSPYFKQLMFPSSPDSHVGRGPVEHGQSAKDYTPKENWFSLP